MLLGGREALLPIKRRQLPWQPNGSFALPRHCKATVLGGVGCPVIRRMRECWVGTPMAPCFYFMTDLLGVCRFRYIRSRLHKPHNGLGGALRMLLAHALRSNFWYISGLQRVAD